MKKTILLLLSFFVVVSCSDNQEVSEPTSPHSTARIARADLQLLYDNMINSQDYKNLETAQDIFFDKMNFTGSNADLESLGTLGWVQANISDTDFISEAAAELEYENLLALTGIVLDNNTDFFDAFLDEDNHPDLIEIMSPPTTIYEDPCGCESAFNACKKGVDIEYAKATKLAKEAEGIVSAKAYKKMMTDANTAKQNGKFSCNRAKDLCISGCE